jgi:hypothetical protein
LNAEVAFAPVRVLLFNCCAASHLAARVHSSACPMVAAAKKSRGRVKVRTEGALHVALDEEIADLNERGFPVRECRCLGSRP